MEPDTFEDLLSHYTTKTRMLVRTIKINGGKILDIERRIRDVLVEHDRRLASVEKTTQETNGFFSSLFSGLGQMVAERKAKKK